MSPVSHNLWLHRFAVLTALATFLLLGAGGLVTSHGVGMAVPDWPNTYGYNLFFFPFSKWVGGIFYEHTHRLIAAGVGLLTGILALWLYGRNARSFMRWGGLVLFLAGVGSALLVPKRWADGTVLASTGAALCGASFFWSKCEASSKWLRRWGLVAFFAVVLQGVLGGLRVVLFKDQIGIFHALLAQLFFVLLCAIALVTSKWWRALTPALSRRTGEGEGTLTPALSHPMGEGEVSTPAGDSARLASASASLSSPSSSSSSNPYPAAAGMRLLRCLFFGTTSLVLLQLVIGATMRHQHAGLAIPDFPLAYGKLWPATDAPAVAHYNEQRIEVTAAKPITAFQIELQMVHRLIAVLILAGVAVCAWRAHASAFLRTARGGDKLKLELQARRAARTRSAAILAAGSPGILPGVSTGGRDAAVTRTLEACATAETVVSRLTWLWLGLILTQVALGAVTIWSNKAADIATAHVLVGALSLATGAILCIVSIRSPERAADLASAEPSSSGSADRMNRRDAGGALNAAAAGL